MDLPLGFETRATGVPTYISNYETKPSMTLTGQKYLNASNEGAFSYLWWVPLVWEGLNRIF